MLLAIDAGNTNVVFALIAEGGDIRHQWRISTKNGRTADEYTVWVSQLMALNGTRPEDVEAAVIASVVPQILFHLEGLCRNYFGVEPLIVGTEGCDLGIKVHLPNPAEVGADRLVNAVAGHARHGGPLIIIDFGTATTFDVVGDEGDYHGGVIAPGINLSVDALYMAAARLPRIAVELPRSDKVIGKSTEEAMQSGVIWGYIGLIEGLIKRIAAEWAKPMTVVATGGLGTLFESQSDLIDVTDRDLTLAGLYLIHRRNTGG